MAEKFEGIIKWIRQETPKVKVFRIALDRPLEFVPGQNVVVSLPSVKGPRGLPVKRVYSVASSPRTTEYIELCVAIYPPPSFSSELEKKKVGDRVLIEGPFGIFKFRETPSKNVTFIAAGTGIAPIMSMIRSMNDHKRLVRVFFGFHNPAQFIYRDELLHLADEGRILLFPCITEGDTRGFEYTVGRVTDIFPQHAKDVTDGDAYVCGPPSMVKDTEVMLRKLGWTTDRILKEQW